MGVLVHWVGMVRSKGNTSETSERSDGALTHHDLPTAQIMHCPELSSAELN